MNPETSTSATKGGRVSRPQGWATQCNKQLKQPRKWIWVQKDELGPKNEVCFYPTSKGIYYFGVYSRPSLFDWHPCSQLTWWFDWTYGPFLAIMIFHNSFAISSVCCVPHFRKDPCGPLHGQTVPHEWSSESCPRIWCMPLFPTVSHLWENTS